MEKYKREMARGKIYWNIYTYEKQTLSMYTYREDNRSVIATLFENVPCSQISLHIHTVWSGPLMFSYWVI